MHGSVADAPRAIDIIRTALEKAGFNRLSVIDVNA